MKANVRTRVADESRKRGMPILVMIDHGTNMCFSSVVPKKGVHAYAVVRICNDLSLLGHSKSGKITRQSQILSFKITLPL